MSFSIIENGLIASMINLFDTSNNTNTLKYNAGDQVIKILINTAKTHMVSISKFDSTIKYYNLVTSTLDLVITSIKQPINGIISNDGNYLYILTQESYELYRIDLTAPTPTITSITLSITPEMLVTDSLDSKLYLVSYASLLSVVDTATFTESSTITLYTNGLPYMLADFKITSDDSTLIILDIRARQITTIVLATNTVRDFSMNPYAANIYLMSSVLSSDNSTLYVLGRYRTFGYILKFSLSNGILNYLAFQSNPTRIVSIALSTDETILYMLNSITHNLDILSTSDLSFEPSISLPQGPYFFFINSLLDNGFAVNKHSGLITKIDTTTNTVLSSAPSVKSVTAIAADNL